MLAALQISGPVQLAAGLGNVRLVEERVAIADDRLRDQNVGLSREAYLLLDGGADRQNLDVAAAHLVDVQLDADDAVGADGLGLGADVLEGVGAGLVDQLRNRVDLAPAQAAEPGADALADAQRID